MRVVAEYDIKLSKEPDPVSLYKLPQAVGNLRIERLYYKPQSRYLEMDMRHPRMDPRPQGAEDMSSTMTYRSYGFSPQADSWYGKIIHEKRIVLLRRIDCVYLFRPKFEHLEVESEIQGADGYQLRKAESREEQEHRKRNINFHIKRIELEDFVELPYGSRTMSHEYEDLCAGGGEETETRPAKKIERSIFNAKVANLPELVELYGDEKMVRLALSRCTYFRHGRYILSNLFYEKSLHEIRDRILELFNERERITMRDVESFIGDEYFLLEELCVRDGRFFCLRGFCEERASGMDVGMDDEVSKVVKAIEEHQPCSIETIQDTTLLSPETIRSSMSRTNVVKLANERYVIYGGSEKRKKIIDLLVKKKSWKKTDVLRVAESKEFGDLEEFFSIFGEYCELNGSMWGIKE